MEKHSIDHNSEFYNIPIKPFSSNEEHEAMPASGRTRTLDDYINGLKRQKQVNRDKINELSSRNEELHRKIQTLKQAARTNYINQPRIQYFSETNLIQNEGKIQTNDDLNTIIQNRVYEAGLSPSMAGSIGLIRSLESLEDEGPPEYDGIYSIIAEESQVNTDRTILLKEGMYAAVYTRNSIKTSLYEELLEYVKKRGYYPEGPFLIRQLVDAFITANEDELMSEVRIRVRK
ncbi:hypothetical protein SAMN05216353_12451 [Halobacillus alkaliphilus]|uniref:GyrI-like small molecule binding domain-containing protein n=1 Tax=Halobacillus alkaliphilus TaxID=396056 RepID=A0A1I2PCL9_9BACI|nr:hypothetical protein [Halobacillus alkaliphilus]SFG13875.1 hypothetical protein SAMN05216353_12451 [Halobacillus alkaliphilus]